MTKQVAKTNGKAIAIPDELNLPDGAGMENADAQSFAIPFLKLVQKQSPVADPDHDAYVEGTKPGMLYNTVSGALLDPDKEDVYIIPVLFRRGFVEWDKSGGASAGKFVKEYTPSEGEELLRQTKLNEKNQDELPNGNILNDTRYHYVICVHKGGMFPAMIGMDRTQVRPSKNLMANITQMMKAHALRASFQLIFKVGSEARTNDDGTWRVWDIRTGSLLADQDQFAEAADFYKAISSGTVTEDINQMRDDGVATTGETADAGAAQAHQPAASEPAQF